MKWNLIGQYIYFMWDILKLLFNLMYGVWRLSDLKYAPISIFGGTQLKKDSIYMKKAHDLAKKFSENNFPVVTGGGPGIMEAASCGAADLKKNIVRSIGISVPGLDPKGFNRCVQNEIISKYYLVRKWLLIKFSIGFVIFPGGFGTLDEFSDLLALIQTKMQSRVPVILIGVDFWKDLIDWMKDCLLKESLISKEDLSIFYLTDDIDEAFNIIVNQCRKRDFKIN